MERRGFSVTTWIILVTTIISTAAFVFFAVFPNSLDWLALKPSSILQGKCLWTLILHIFVHGGIAHLLVNMFALFSLGGLCERIVGKKRFLWFYLISGVIAGLSAILLSGFFGSSYWGERIFGSADVYMVGASGAIFAIAGLFVVLLPRIRFSIIFLPFFSLPAYVMIPLVLFVLWLLSAVWALPVGNAAHFGGFLAGLIYGVYLKRKYKRKVEMLQRYFR
jgi:membrane associated rhomboid family serine protease